MTFMVAKNNIYNIMPNNIYLSDIYIGILGFFFYVSENLYNLKKLNLIQSV